MGEAVLMVPSTEVRTWCCAARAWRLDWLCEGWTPPAVDGRAGGCAKGEFLPVEGGANWLDSLEVVDRLDSLLREACEREDCDLWPEGECGRGGGRRGGRLVMFALVIPWGFPRVRSAARFRSHVISSLDAGPAMLRESAACDI